jgi:hypothetical protein
MNDTALRPALVGGQIWSIRKCQAGYVITATSDDYKRSVQDHGLVKSLDEAKDRVEGLVGTWLRWSHSTLGDTWFASQAS